MTASNPVAAIARQRRFAAIAARVETAVAAKLDGAQRGALAAFIAFSESAPDVHNPFPASGETVAAFNAGRMRQGRAIIERATLDAAARVTRQ